MNINLLEIVSMTTSPAKHSGKPWDVDKETFTEYAFWIKDNIGYINFQGSMSFEDWMQNINIMPLFWKASFVHMGIFRKYAAISKQLTEFLTTTNCERYYFLGHSQGAGISLIAMMLNKNVDTDKTFAYLIGAPKVFSFMNRFFSLYKKIEKLKDNIFLIENGNDVVTKIPFWDIKIGHVIHVGAKRRFWKFSIKEHFPKYYRNAIKEFVEVKNA